MQPAQTERHAEDAAARTNKLNTVLIDKARGDASVAFLASPVTGGGIAVSRIEQLFLLARRNGQDHRAAFVSSMLQQQGERLVKDGRTIEEPEANLAELTAQAEDFEQKREPILNALGIS